MEILPAVEEWTEAVVAYYRALAKQNLPPGLIEKLVVSWQEYMLYLVRNDNSDKVF